MTRDEYRKACINASGLAIARNMFPEHNLKTLDELGLRLKECYLSAGEDSFDALHGIARVNSIEATEAMVEAYHTAIAADDGNLSDVFAAMSAAGDLTNPPEKKP